MHNYNHNQISRTNANGFFQQQSNQPQLNQLKKNQMEKNQTEQQCYQGQLQDQALIQYYIFEDFQYLINLIYSFQQVSEYFKTDPKNELVTISKNKLIAQLNISNSLHYDLQKSYENYQQLIYNQKQKVMEMIRQLPKDIQNSQYLTLYKKNSLSPTICLSSQQFEQINTPPNFNQQVVSHMFASIRFIDKNVEQIKAKNYYAIPNSHEVQSKAMKYAILTKEKLEASFPKKYCSQSQMRGSQSEQICTQSQIHSNTHQSKDIMQYDYQQQNYSQNRSSQLTVNHQQQRGTSNQLRQSYIQGYQNLSNS